MRRLAFRTLRLANKEFIRQATETLKRPVSLPEEPALPDDGIAGKFTHDGRAVSYRLYVPPGKGWRFGARQPLVLMLHGCNQGAQDFAMGTRMHVVAREVGVAVLYAEQTQRANPQKCWNWFKEQHQRRGSGEPGLLSALVKSVAADNDVDMTRIYVAGLSAGGAMADILGHCYPDLFAAIGVHSGLPAGSATDVMSAFSAMRRAVPADGQMHQKGPPAIVFHGDADATVHISNGEAIAARRSVAEFRRLAGAGHAWSGGDRSGSYTDPAGIDASREMLRFFLEHSLAT
jgi:poly(hydroxyalkanoate) depolymerase family esterase